MFWKYEFGVQVLKGEKLWLKVSNLQNFNLFQNKNLIGILFMILIIRK